jgi:hypothetical protein
MSHSLRLLEGVESTVTSHRRKEIGEGQFYEVLSLVILIGHPCDIRNL